MCRRHRSIDRQLGHRGRVDASFGRQTMTNMSSISDALVSRDLISRVISVQDRRRIVVRITEQGENLVRRLLPQLFVSLRCIFVEFSESEQRLLISQLKRLHANMEGVNKQFASGAR
jgi:DNA-binding MarR family transcriptional regulator